MNRHICTICCMVLGLISLLSACIDDKFTTSPSDTLTFSADTINFDTIFTDEGTSTKTLKVYNRSNKSLRISSIQLAKGATSGFIVNVDGVSGTSFTDTEIRGQDSLFIFIIARIAETGNATPTEARDSLIFNTNGVYQEVKLLAQSQDAKRMRSITINSDSILTAQKPFIIYDSLVVAPNVTLTINPGATLYFHNKASLIVYGQLVAEGTAEQPITLRGDRLDKLFDNLPYNNLAGQWGGVRFCEGSFDNKLTHVMLRSSTWGIICDSTDIERSTLTIHNSILHNATENILTANHNNIHITNSELSDAGASVLSAAGGYLVLTHCTIVNYYFYDIIKGSIINVPTIETIKEKNMKLSFNNCLITGNASPLSEGDFSGTEIFFNSCLIGVEGEDDANFIHTQWKGDPHFLTIDKENYIYDYRIGSDKSDAIGWGEKTYAEPPLDKDMYGTSRAERVDAGAYQYIEPATE